MNLAQLKKKWQGEPAFRKEYEVQRPEFALAWRMISARRRAGLSQSEVARRMKTTQSAVARLEAGGSKPSLSSLMRYAEAVGHRVDVRLVHASHR